MVSKRYFLSRTVQAVVTLWAVMTFTFLLIRWMPGSPQSYIMNRLMDPDADPDEVRRVMEQYLQYIPDEPLHVQYYNYMTGLLQGNLGTSTWYQEPVAEIVAEAMPWTVYLSAVSLVLTFVIGVGLGAIMAYKEKSNFDVGMTLYSIVAQAFPYYVFAILLLWVFSFQWGWFPVGGRFGADVTPGLNVGFVTSLLRHSTLPILSLVIIGFGGTVLGMRANSIRVLGEDYLRVGRLRGLSDQRLAFLYVGRNAILPLYTGLMIQIGSLFGGSVILETIFTYHGMGYFMFEAVNARDYPLMMGSFLFITTGVIVGVFIADLSYGYIDPRAGSADTRESFAGDIGSFHTVVIQWFRRKVKGVTGGDGDTDQLRTNGGGAPSLQSQFEEASAEDSPFGAVSDRTYTRRERLQTSLETWVFSPIRILANDWRALTGFSIILLYVLMGTVGVLLTSPPEVTSYGILELPFQSWEYPLGTNDGGKSILHQVIHATPDMFRMMIGGAVYGTVMAAIWGFTSGYIGGRIDRIMMAIADTLMTIPGLPLVIVLGVTLEPRNAYLVGVIITINGWAGASRNWRSQVLTLREESYVEASRTMGLSTWRIISRDILPNMAPLMMVRFVSLTRAVISTSVALYFLGILPYTSLNWGVMLNRAYQSGTWYTTAGIHWLVVPIVTIVLLGFGLILFGQACDHILNPRIRARHDKATSDDVADDGAVQG
ncbi:ABC transporter permease subunit [Halomontanus rarus]|uniref:ABC transporter permease subunit n=1 Tax=Halomontanus rarus TaxID=3034020 RepID=UPI0023E8383D|nr:ABC transporter permease subunit [Halovivax sp. TS33]